MTRVRSLALPVTALVAALCALGPVPASVGAEAEASDLVTTMEIEGTLIVTSAESEVGESQRAGREYTVLTESGASLPVEPSADLEGARTGDAFEGVVEVPGAIAGAVDGRPADSSIAPSLGSSDALADAAADAGVDLRVLTASITEAVVGDEPRDHVADVVFYDDSGFQPVGAPYTDQQLRDLAESSGRFWQQASTRPGFSGITSFAASTSVTRLEWNGSCGWSASALWDDAAARLGYKDRQGYLNAASPASGPIRHLIVFQPPKCLSAEGYGFDGDENGAYSGGTIGAGVNAGGLAVVTLGDLDSRITTHLLGHNLGIGHANLDVCDKDAVATGCDEWDAADFYDVMGFPLDDQLTALNSATKVAVGWNDPATTPTLTLGADETTRTWPIALSPVGSAGDAAHPPIVVAEDPITGERLTVEHRPFITPAPWYAAGYTIALDGRGGSPVWYAPGVRLLRSTPDGGTSAFTSPSGIAGTDQAAAAFDAGEQRDVVRNPSKSVVVKVLGGDPSGVVNVEVTLSRPIEGATPVYRFWSDRLQGHFYTISEFERDKVIRTWPETWTYEGSRYDAFKTQQPGTVPLYRFWSERLGGHFYTVSAAERDRVIRTWPDVWAYEGVAYYVYPVETDAPSTVLVSRFWSPTKQHHFYTADPTERDRVIRLWPSPIWDYEGDAFRVPYEAK